MSDQDLIEYLAIRGMGWNVYAVSHHRPRSRPLPHAWRWRRGEVVQLMVWDGAANRAWDPLTSDGDAFALSAALVGRLTLPAGVVPQDRRAFCSAAADALSLLPEDPFNP